MYVCIPTSTQACTADGAIYKELHQKIDKFFPRLLGKISLEPLPGPGLYKPSIKILGTIEVLYGEEYGWLVVFINRQFRFCR